MRLYFSLAWRNIWRNKRRSLISMSSILFAVMLAIMSRSMMIGTFERMIDTIVGTFSGYIQVHQEGYFDSSSLDDIFVPSSDLLAQIEGTEHVTLAVPRLESFALVSSGDNTNGARIIGIDPAKEDQMTAISERISTGSYFTEASEGIILGSELAKDLKKTVGDTIILLGSGYHGITAAGRFVVEGLVSFPADEMSAALAYLPLPVAQHLYGVEEGITTLAVMLDHARNLERARNALEVVLSDEYEVITWKMMVPELDQLVQMKYVGQDLVLALIYIVVGFGILGTVLMMTMERLREFGMVTALGMKKRTLAIIVLIESSLLTLSGAIAAMVLTIPILAKLQQEPIQLTGKMAEGYESYGFEPVLAFTLHAPIFFWQTFFVLLIALVSSSYPFFRISKLNSVEAMRTGH
ncbi:ABC transporter permease [bacterium]|nr:ABC transporter permease [bacterium]